MALLNLKKFTFNDFQENTYLLYNDKGYGIIIDPGCYYKEEQDHLKSFIAENNIKIERLIMTHSHIDHILGCHFVAKEFGVTLEVHEQDLQTFLSVKSYADVYGFKNYIEADNPKTSLKEGENISFDEENELEIRYVPGHAPGHVVFINHKEKYVINGDCLFMGSIGRTDLPGGNHEQLLESIRRELFSLPDDYTVYCGHGPETTIGYEKQHNPFLN